MGMIRMLVHTNMAWISILCSFVWHEGVGSSRLTKNQRQKNKKGDFGLRPLTFGVSFGFFFFFVGWQQPVQPPCVLVLHDRWWEAMPRTHNVYCGHDDTLRSIWISIVCSLQLHECVSSSCLSKIYIRKKNGEKVSQGSIKCPLLTHPP